MYIKKYKITKNKKKNNNEMRKELENNVCECTEFEKLHRMKRKKHKYRNYIIKLFKLNHFSRVL